MQPISAREGQDLAHTLGLFPYLQLYLLATNSRPRTQLPCSHGVSQSESQTPPPLPSPLPECHSSAGSPAIPPTHSPPGLLSPRPIPFILAKPPPLSMS